MLRPKVWLAAAASLAIFSLSPVAAHASSSSPSFNLGLSSTALPQNSAKPVDEATFTRPGEATRSFEAIPSVNGLSFNLQPTDKLQLNGAQVEVLDESGKLLIALTPELQEGSHLVLDEENQDVFVVEDGATLQSCTDNKWVKWGIQGGWDILVCVPAALGGGGALGGAVCHMAGSGLVTAASC